MSARGHFIVLEGGEASGKSTQVARLADRLRAQGREVVVTFAPGATARGAKLRELLLDDHSALEPRAELLMLAADRAQHVAEVIEPALTRGADVVCDRFHPSTMAYQGVARGLGVDEVERICDWAAGGVEPDLVVVLDVDDDVADERLRVEPDRLESAGKEFHRQVRHAYRDLAAARDWVVIDGAPGADAVADAIWSAVAAALEPRPT